MNEDDLKKRIQLHEGFRPYVYVDSEGYLTGGYGHAFLAGSRISHDVAELLFKEDFEDAVKKYEKLDLELDTVRKGVVIEMIYQLGLSGVRGFKKMLNYLKINNYEKAAEEMLDSLWANQTKCRAIKLSRIMKTGSLDGVA